MVPHHTLRTQGGPGGGWHNLSHFNHSQNLCTFALEAELLRTQWPPLDADDAYKEY